jgi:hypothetical protein
MKHSSIILIILLVMLTPTTVQASLLDFFGGDWWCVLFGCVVINNTHETIVYELSGPGGPASLYAVIAGTPPIGTVESGATDLVVPPGPEEGTMLGIDTDGDEEAELFVQDTDSDGFLDAGDDLSSFTLTSSTDVTLSTRDIQHSFYVASNRPFAIYARVISITSGGDIGASVGPGDIGYQIVANANGTDDGFSYGGWSTAAGFQSVAGITSLADIGVAPVMVAECTRAQGTKTNPFFLPVNLSRQFVRLTNRYRLPTYDLSQGTGNLDVTIEYLIYKP